MWANLFLSPWSLQYWVGKNLYLLLTPKQGLWSA